MEIHADVLLKATKVDGIYDADPMKDPTATRYNRITYLDVLKQEPQGHGLDRDLALPGQRAAHRRLRPARARNILRVVMGETIGTLVGHAQGAEQPEA